MMDFSVLIPECSQYFLNIKLNVFSFFYLLEKENWFEIFLMLWIAKRDGELSDNIKCSLHLTYKINRTTYDCVCGIENMIQGSSVSVTDRVMTK